MAIQRKEQDVFSLDNFTGPLHFLLQLIEKNEIDIRDVAINRITTQYLQGLQDLMKSNVDSGTDFVGMAAKLIWLKSRILLPNEKVLAEEDEMEQSDPQLQLVQKIVEYYHCKQQGKELAQRDQQGFYLRQPPPPLSRSFSQLDIMNLEDLASLYRNLMENMERKEETIDTEEEWSVGDKIDFLREKLSEEGKIAMGIFFRSIRSREEAIVSFLALLELMKMGEVRIDPIEKKIYLAKM